MKNPFASKKEPTSNNVAVKYYQSDSEEDEELEKDYKRALCLQQPAKEKEPETIKSKFFSVLSGVKAKFKKESDGNEDFIDPDKL